ncbi:uncharacterized protein GGS22DRAFT_175685 [Annulohypoxylon maeteangense]|uniref:uncharacterized protein n=1 Tax=Annulohypoxylon maeteangense TaxID=1927788 RepID=UPI0020081640|nr:uncharacterized protein GGS22DRAFT_175685 [Annulohypoxylon maeteangense]KAI0880165.1 hypothetical protein GGS22DRAFT_175685 [Annulohypoxylon maeteangense]
MSLIAIAWTVTISQVGLSLATTSSDVLDATIPISINTSSMPMKALDAAPESDSVMTLSVLFPTLTPSPTSTDQQRLDLSATIPNISLGSLTSPTASRTSLNNPDNTQEPSTVFSPERGLSRGQITAIIASVVSVTVLIIVISIAVRCFVVRRRLYSIEELPKRNLEISSAGKESRTEQGYKSETRTSVTESNRSSIWGVIGQSIVPTSSNDDVWDSRHWPLPPGHSERYTFFSERSSTSMDGISETEQWGGYQNENRNTRDHDLAVIRRELGMRSRCDSIWGISDAGIAH